MLQHLMYKFVDMFILHFTDVNLSLYSGTTRIPNGEVSFLKSKFDDKIESSSAKMYFHYYGQLLHQQNMLQDYVRTGYIS